MQQKNKPCRQIIVTRVDLPLSCPQKNNNQVSWDQHPIVYLPIQEQKILTCPYCQTEYIFAETNSKA